MLPGLLVVGVVGISPTMLFALERANIDLVIFAMVVSVSYLFAGGPRARVTGYALVTLATMLKFYPAVLLAIAARERPVRFVVIVSACLLALFVYVAAQYISLVRAIALVPSAHWHPLAFGANLLLRGLAQMGPRWAPLAQIAWPALLTAMLFVVVPLNRGPYLRTLLSGLDRLQSAQLLVGALLVPACFLAGQSYIYRGLFLLPILPAALTLARQSMLFRLVVTGVLVLSWCWVLRLPDQIAGLTYFDHVVWFAIQATWWALVSVLLAIVVNMLLNGAAGVWLRDQVSRLLSRPARNLS